MSVIFIAVLAFGLAAFTGCNDDDDKGKIRVCNYDNNTYVVKLHRDSDGAVLEEFEVREWNDTDLCDKFEDVDDGRYYLTIHIDNQPNPSDTSESFYVDNGDYETFTIDTTGDIDRD